MRQELIRKLRTRERKMYIEAKKKAAMEEWLGKKRIGQGRKEEKEL